jgi:hypothetical protein
MANMVDVLQVSPHTLIQRIRRLPLAGRVLVAIGDAVRPTDLIAEAVLPAGVMTLDVGRGLGVSPQEADACALRKPGDKIKAGDLLAQCEGTLPRAVRAPADGVLVDYSRGKAILSTRELKVTIQAGMPGVVEDIFPEFGAKIRVEGGLVQGEWGNGGCAEGPLQVLERLDLEDEDLILTAGEILVLPAVTEPSVFEAVRTADLAGLVTFWLAPTLMAQAAACAAPVLVVSGFGEGAVDPQAWDLLQASQGKLSGLNAGGGQRPELIIPGESASPDEALGLQAALAVGQRVRILTGAAAGQAGVVSRLEAPLMFESGFAYPTATIDLIDGQQVQVPQRNLVILGL